LIKPQNKGNCTQKKLFEAELCPMIGLI